MRTWRVLLLIASLVLTPTFVAALSLGGGGGGGRGFGAGFICRDVGGNHVNTDDQGNPQCGSSNAIAGNPGNAAADGTTKGIAGFNSSDFTASNGIVSLATTLAGRTLTNTTVLTIKDANATFQATGDTTKQLKLDLSLIPTSTSLSLKVPSFTTGDVLLTANSTKTLTNTTCTSCTITSPVGIVAADVGLGSVSNTSDATKNAASVTLTNHTLDNTNTVTLKDANATFQATGDITKQGRFSLAPLTTGNTRVWSMFDASDTVMCLTCAQSPTGKSLSGSTNTFTNIPESAFSFTDLTIGNASTSAHGLLKKLPGTTGVFLEGTGNFVAVSGAAPGSSCANDGSHANVYDTGTGWACALITGAGGGGNVASANSGTSIDSELVLWSGTGGLTIKRASGTGIAKATAGVLSFVTAPAGTILGTTDAQSVASKTHDNTNIYTTRADRQTWQDTSDTTKQAKLDLSLITTGTTRQPKLPDSSSQLVDLDSDQLLTNKNCQNCKGDVSFTTPRVIGGLTTTSTLELRTTQANSTTGADIIFTSGNNGSVELARILNNGNMGLGTASPATLFHLLGASAELRQAGSAANQDLSHTFYDNNSTKMGSVTYVGSAGSGSKVVKLSNDAGDGLALNSASTAPFTVTLNSAERFRLTSAPVMSFGPASTTNPSFQVDGSASSAATGWKITAQAAGTSPMLAVISSGTNEGGQIDTKGSGDLFIHKVSSGHVYLGGTVPHTWGIARNTTSNTAGQALTIPGGSATSGATNKAAGGVVIQSGLSTGNVGGTVDIETTLIGTASGTSDNSLVKRAIFEQSKALANNTFTTIATMTLASNSVIGFFADYGIEVFDGTNLQVEVGTVSCHAINKGGTVDPTTATCTKICGNVDQSSGTLAVTWQMASNLVQVKANSSLTPSAGYPRLTLSSAKNMTSQVMVVN